MWKIILEFVGDEFESTIYVSSFSDVLKYLDFCASIRAIASILIVYDEGD